MALKHRKLFANRHKEVKEEESQVIL